MTQPALKKFKTDPESSKDSDEFEAYLSCWVDERKRFGASILDFKFNEKRFRLLSKSSKVPSWAEGVTYWMTREQRVQDNWSLLFAQKVALEKKLPLHICFCLRPKFMDATLRHYKFMLKGLKEVAEECTSLKIPFHLLVGDGEKLMVEFIKNNKIGAVVVDFSPLRVPLKWIDDIKDKIPSDVPLYQVDGHNIVPCWVASDKLEYAARTIRNKINGKLNEFLTPFPLVAMHPHASKLKAEEISWDELESKLEVDTSVDEVEWAKPGYRAGMKTLFEFCNKRLQHFKDKRNDPTKNALSHLSPWFHFGQISIQRCVINIRPSQSRYNLSVQAFFEEAIVRRELADNFCFYNPNYDNIKGAYEWAQKTLNDHRKDKRQYVYTRDEFANSKTHDDLWNSAQIQLVKEGKMHGFLRMYWAKKILEWTESPEQAIEFALYLNDKYSLDGRDPNGFVGCMWSICGIHDQGWRERPIFGKIRYMNYEGCKRKFDVAAYVARYGGKVHKKKSK